MMVYSGGSLFVMPMVRPGPVPFLYVGLAAAKAEGTPWWVWILILLALALFAAILIWWWMRTHGEEEGTLPESRRSTPVPGPLTGEREGTAYETAPTVTLGPPASGFEAPVMAVEAPTVSLEEAPAEAELPTIDVERLPIEVKAPPVADVMPAAVPEEPETPVTPDDLQRIEGIGPKISGVLQAAGIPTFARLAMTEVWQLRQILEQADPRLLRLADPTTWPEQAKLAAEGAWDALQELQDELKGGRRA
jgi:predicted flap endonuclease-1-like 5' DNA nuclease